MEFQWHVGDRDESPWQGFRRYRRKSGGYSARTLDDSIVISGAVLAGWRYRAVCGGAFESAT